MTSTAYTARLTVIDRLARHLLHSHYPMLDWDLMPEPARDAWRTRAAVALEAIGTDALLAYASTLSATHGRAA